MVMKRTMIGQYDSGVGFGQRRVLLVWNRLILPNGRSIVLERQPSADAEGYAGLEDGVEPAAFEIKVRSPGFGQWVGRADAHDDTGADHVQHRSHRHQIGVAFGRVGHDARAGERQRPDRSEVLHHDRRDRTRSLADARDRAETPHAGERSRQHRAADAVDREIDAPPGGQRRYLGHDIGITTDDDMVRAVRTGQRGLLVRPGRAEHRRAEMPGPAGEDRTEPAGSRMNEKRRSGPDWIGSGRRSVVGVGWGWLMHEP
jgi:type IV secretory pathway VirB10-like protein